MAIAFHRGTRGALQALIGVFVCSHRSVARSTFSPKFRPLGPKSALHQRCYVHLCSVKRFKKVGRLFIILWDSEVQHTLVRELGLLGLPRPCLVTAPTGRRGALAPVTHNHYADQVRSRREGWFRRPVRTPVSLTHTTKLILRPTAGLSLAKRNPSDFHAVLSLAASLTPAEARQVTVKIAGDKNLALITSEHGHATEKVKKLTSLNEEGSTHTISIYESSPENAFKGVIHSIRQGTSPKYLERHLTAPGYRILAARMMGRTATAINTFEGSYIPREVLFAGGVYRFFPHRPRA